MERPTSATIKRLFALSGNQCAMPKCPNPIVDTRTGTVVGDVCHIRAHHEGAARFEPAVSRDELHHFDNLILLCTICHRIIDDNVEEYSAQTLIDIKARHEAKGHRVPEPGDRIVESLLHRLDEVAAKVDADVLKLVSSFEIALGQIDIAELISLVPGPLTPLKNVFAKLRAEDFLREAGLEDAPDLDRGSARPFALRELIVFLLQTAWDKGYFLWKFRRHNRIPMPRKDTNRAILDQLISRAHNVTNLSVFVDVNVQRAISLCTQERAIRSTFEVFSCGDELLATLEPHLDAWATTVRTAFGFGALISQTEDELYDTSTA